MDGLTIDEAAERMGISKHTLLNGPRKSIASAPRRRVEIILGGL